MASWNIRVDGKEYGPYADVEIRAFAREGRIQPNTELKRLPSGAWVEAKMIKGIEFLETPAAPPSIGNEDDEDDREEVEESDDGENEPAAASQHAESAPTDRQIVYVPTPAPSQSLLPWGISILIGIVFILVGGLLGLAWLGFLFDSSRSESAPQQAAVGAQYGATFVGLYVVARCIEKALKGLSGAA